MSVCIFICRNSVERYTVCSQNIMSSLFRSFQNHFTKSFIIYLYTVLIFCIQLYIYSFQFSCCFVAANRFDYCKATLNNITVINLKFRTESIQLQSFGLCLCNVHLTKYFCIRFACHLQFCVLSTLQTEIFRFQKSADCTK